MKSSTKLSILGALLLLTAYTAQATPITWTDTINFSPDVYLLQWNAALNPATDASGNFSLNLDQLGAAANGSLTGTAWDGLMSAGDAQWQGTGALAETIVDLLESLDLEKEKHHHHKGGGPETVPEPGILSLLGLGLLALAFATRRTRRLRAAGGTTSEAFSAIAAS